MNNRVLSFIKTAALAGFGLALMAGGVEGASVTLTLPEATGAPGSEVAVPIMVRNAEGLGPFQFDVVFDPAVLTPIGVADGSGGKVGLVDHNLVEPNRLSIAASGQPSQPIQDDGTLLLITFAVSGELGDSSPLVFENPRAWEQSVEALDMFVSHEAGSFTVEEAGVPLWWFAAGAAALLLAGMLALALRKRGAPRHPVAEKRAAGPAHRFCAQCGTPLPEAAAFCAKCGQAVS